MRISSIHSAKSTRLTSRNFRQRRQHRHQAIPLLIPIPMHRYMQPRFLDSRRCRYQNFQAITSIGRLFTIRLFDWCIQTTLFPSLKDFIYSSRLYAPLRTATFATYRSRTQTMKAHGKPLWTDTRITVCCSRIL